MPPTTLNSEEPIKVICYARTYEIGSPEAGEYRQIPEHLQRILDRAAAESK